MVKMEEFGKVSEIEDADEAEEAGLNSLLDAASICLMKQRPELWDYEKNNGKGGHSDLAEEVLDMPTVYRIIEICGGIKLDDPNLIAAAMESQGRSTPGLV